MSADGELRGPDGQPYSPHVQTAAQALRQWASPVLADHQVEELIGDLIAAASKPDPSRLLSIYLSGVVTGGATYALNADIARTDIAQKMGTAIAVMIRDDPAVAAPLVENLVALYLSGESPGFREVTSHAHLHDHDND